MDAHVDEIKGRHAKKCNNLHKASLVLSAVFAILTIALSLRMNDSYLVHSRVNDSKKPFWRNMKTLFLLFESLTVPLPRTS